MESGFHGLARQVHLTEKHKWCLRRLKTIGDNRSLEGNLTDGDATGTHQTTQTENSYHTFTNGDKVTNISSDHVNCGYKLQIISYSCGWDGRIHPYLDSVCFNHATVAIHELTMVFGISGCITGF